MEATLTVQRSPAGGKAVHCKVGDRVIIARSALSLVVGSTARITHAVPKGRWVVELENGPVQGTIPEEHVRITVSGITADDDALILVSDGGRFPLETDDMELSLAAAQDD